MTSLEEEIMICIRLQIFYLENEDLSHQIQWENNILHRHADNFCIRLCYLDRPNKRMYILLDPRNLNPVEWNDSFMAISAYLRNSIHDGFTYILTGYGKGADMVHYCLDRMGSVPKKGIVFAPVNEIIPNGYNVVKFLPKLSKEMPSPTVKIYSVNDVNTAIEFISLCLDFNNSSPQCVSNDVSSNPSHTPYKSTLQYLQRNEQDPYIGSPGAVMMVANPVVMTQSSDTIEVAYAEPVTSYVDGDQLQVTAVISNQNRNNSVVAIPVNLPMTGDTYEDCCYLQAVRILRRPLAAVNKFSDKFNATMTEAKLDTSEGRLNFFSNPEILSCFRIYLTSATYSLITIYSCPQSVPNFEMELTKTECRDAWKFFCDSTTKNEYELNSFSRHCSSIGIEFSDITEMSDNYKLFVAVKSNHAIMDPILQYFKLASQRRLYSLIGNAGTSSSKKISQNVIEAWGIMTNNRNCLNNDDTALYCLFKSKGIVDLETFSLVCDEHQIYTGIASHLKPAQSIKFQNLFR